MDYILNVITADGEVHYHGCATMTDVSNHMHSILNSQFGRDLARGTVTFIVVDNTKKET